MIIQLIDCLLIRYLNNHLMNLFAGAWETRDVSPLPVHIPQATDDQVISDFGVSI